MIDIDALRRGPATQEEPTQLFNEDQALNLIKAKAERLQALVLPSNRWVDYSLRSITLFRISAENSLGAIAGFTDQDGGLLERGRLQEIGFEIMNEFGIDLGSRRPRHKGTPWNYPEGTSREISLYRSATPGLEFEESVYYWTNGDGPIDVRWTGIITKPIAFDLRSLLSPPRSRTVAV